MSRKVNKTQDLFSAMDFEDNAVVEKNEKSLDIYLYMTYLFYNLANAKFKWEFIFLKV